MTATALDHQPITIIKLSGPLIRDFGREHRRFLDTGTVQEAFSALRNTLPGFKESIQRLQNKGMRFAIFRNRKNIGQDDLSGGGTREVRIVPVLTGSKRAGLLQTIVGAVLVVAGAMTRNAFLIQAGAGLAIGGVTQMLSPQAKGLSQSAAPENLPSYAFGSARNTTASGNPVPICYGKRRWGGAIISASIYAEDKV
ncbi:tail assembly protein [Pseudomonas aeruginosa]|uniref:tail assembly protein n=1 Tax=Pseudomonas aeruginosa TaxID=287 RepID=UPI0015F05DF0|nr:tail assembly protein [Pseudomonas aeruginosa]MBA5115478.1 tail assembly protein [Pseudomonas aeruginosa]